MPKWSRKFVSMMNPHDPDWEVISLLHPDDPVRREAEAALTGAGPRARGQYADLVAESQALRESVTPAVPESLLERLRRVPRDFPAVYRPARFLTPFRAVAAAVLVLVLLAPALAIFVPPALRHHRLEVLPAEAVSAAAGPVEMAATRPSEISAQSLRTELSFYPDLPEPRAGTTFLGGGITRLAGKMAAYGRYERKGQRFTVFQVAQEDFPLPAEGRYPLVPTATGDQDVQFWADGGTVLLLVADCEMTGGSPAPGEILNVDVPQTQ